MERISIHALREEGDLRKRLLRPRPWNFYPRPPRGGRHSSIGIKRGSRLFLSTPSARRATPSTTLPKSNTRNFYPRPPRGGRPRPRRRRCWRRSNFYPRPPRGGRRYSDVPLDDHVRISIHALREEGDCPSGSYSHKHDVFLSTPSARRATTISSISRTTMHISIHALREEGDRPVNQKQINIFKFLSTPSARRATFVPSRLLWEHFEFLSTPSARRATGHRGHGERCRVFLSTPSARRATFKRDYSLLTTIFLSTPSARRATRRKASRLHCLWAISIHALREEGDGKIDIESQREKNFYPRPPRGGRRAVVAACIWMYHFYPRPPRGGRPGKRTLQEVAQYIFLSTPSARRAT